VEGEERREIMKQQATIFNNSPIRIGRLQLSQLAFRRMNENKLTPEILEDVFKYGKELEEGMLVEKYDTYTVGMYYTVDQTRVFRGDLENVRFIIITCWKQKNKKEE
jgi:hypothetical protein